MQHTEIWRYERKLWIDDILFFKQLLAENCVMTFPKPVGSFVAHELLKLLSRPHVGTL